MGEVKELFLRAVALRKAEKTGFTIRRLFLEEGIEASTVEEVMYWFEVYRSHLTKRALGVILVFFGSAVGVVVTLFFLQFLAKGDTRLMIFVGVMALITYAGFLLGIWWIYHSTRYLARLKNKTQELL
ncbi:MAG: hypothetical protein ACFB0B_16795 [Thermonemataceae bacterium]